MDLSFGRPAMAAACRPLAPLVSTETMGFFCASASASGPWPLVWTTSNFSASLATAGAGTAKVIQRAGRDMRVFRILVDDLLQPKILAQKARALASEAR